MQQLFASSTMAGHDLNVNCIIQRVADVIAAEADQDLVMVSIQNGKYYGVSNVARSIWEKIEHPKKVADLIDELSSAYSVDRSTCEEETLLFLRDLLAEHLLQVNNAPST